MSIFFYAFRPVFLALLGTVFLGHALFAQPGGQRATTIQPSEACPPRTTEIPPRSCMAPEEAAPSILDYRPRSTLVAPTHLVQKARYPAIDFHGHPWGVLGSVA